MIGADDLELSPLGVLADLPGAALRVVLPLGLAIGLCLYVLLGAMVANPYAALAPAERERVDPAAIVAAPLVNVAPGADAVGSPLGLQAVQWARAQIGKPYVWGGAGPDGFDCSGLMQWAWARVGVRIPKFTVDQYYSLQPVSVPELQPGDLIFLEYTYPADYRITHVGMFTERGTVVEAPTVGVPIREVPFGRYTATKYFGSARPRLPAG